jgi:hypothetical protein
MNPARCSGGASGEPIDGNDPSSGSVLPEARKRRGIKGLMQQPRRGRGESHGSTDAPGVRTGKPLIESDRVEGTTVYGLDGNQIGTIKRLMIEKISGRVAYAVMAFGGFLGLGEEEHTIPWDKLTYDTGLGGYRTDITEEQLQGAPTIYRDRDYDWTDRQREQERHYRYGARYYGGGGL